MASKPRKASKPRLKVIGHIGTPESVVELLTEALIRAQDGETLAVGLIEVAREGDVLFDSAGEENGFRHQIVAGAVYLQNSFQPDDE